MTNVYNFAGQKINPCKQKLINLDIQILRLFSTDKIHNDNDLRTRFTVTAQWT